MTSCSSEIAISPSQFVVLILSASSPKHQDILVKGVTHNTHRRVSQQEVQLHASTFKQNPEPPQGNVRTRNTHLMYSVRLAAS